ncbi:uncharacterized protein LOC121385661 isoform X2 [Gigantopelta aegis]|uniref:uncharacterized protein LOC121385661 isoform X2 n=1 Tax=Gigantopelta aegis TaxID=1735272 RepID=UPI001B88B293|nr:uncharacterized protein LOC121385661 isoform X2 [Gigantopelta aegis]
MKSVFLTLDVVVLWLAVVVQGDGDELAPMTWYQATKACRTHGELYHSADKSHVGQFLGSNSGKHWIGAKVMYSSWTWTEDRSTLFTYVGYRNVTEKDKKVNKTFLYTNQAVRCYPECKPNATYIGLQGSKCFCLHSPKNTTENTAQNRCWGNSQESCGTAHGMSVYKVELLMTDGLKWKFGLNDICGYLNVTDCDDPVVDTHTKKQCQEKNYGRICNCDGEDPDDYEYTSEDKGDWSAANQSCSLLKIKHTIDCDDEDKKPYWIGLSRYRYIGWVKRDGSIDVPDTGRSGCVWAERLRNDTVVFGIKACHEKLQASLH